ncbi:hypothetical protein [Chitinophaga silvatica]|nr:hypothetical protein [Chitinophaga silvatica]
MRLFLALATIYLIAIVGNVSAQDPDEITNNSRFIIPGGTT